MSSSGAETNDGSVPERPDLMHEQFSEQQIVAGQRLFAYLELSPEEGGPQPHSGPEMSIVIQHIIAETQAKQQNYQSENILNKD